MGFEDDVIKATAVAGNKNRYQLTLMIILCLIFYFDAFLLLGPSFYFMDPQFICDGSDAIVDELQACPKIAQCHIVNDFTITKYMGLYCNRQSDRDLIQAFLSVGSLIGLIVMNFVSDLRGRKLALIIDLVIAFSSSLLTIVGTYSQNMPLLIISSIMAGFSGYSLVVVSYIMAADVCQQQIRQTSSLYMNICYSFGLVTFFFMYNWINQWYNILFLFMFIPFLALTIMSLLLLQQSPNYYLCTRKDKVKCIDRLTNIAIYNGKTEQQIGQIQKLISNSTLSDKQRQAQKAKVSIFSVLKQWQYLKIILFMAIVESGGNVFFYGIQYAISDIGYNYGFDNLVLGITQIIFTFILSRFVHRLKRKKTCVIGYAVCIVFAFLFVIKPIGQSPIFATLIIVGIRASTSFGYFMIVMIQTQSFPIQIKSVGAGTIQAFSQLGSIAAPLIITFAVNNGLPKITTMGLVLAICLVFIKFVPQPNINNLVKKEQLEQTLLESQIQDQSIKV